MSAHFGDILVFSPASGGPAQFHSVNSLASSGLVRFLLQVSDVQPGEAHHCRGRAQARLLLRVAASGRPVHVPHVAGQERAAAAHARELAQTAQRRQGVRQAAGEFLHSAPGSDEVSEFTHLFAPRPAAHSASNLSTSGTWVPEMEVNVECHNFTGECDDIVVYPPQKFVHHVPTNTG